MRLARAPQKLIHHGNGYLGNLFACLSARCVSVLLSLGERFARHLLVTLVCASLLDRRCLRIYLFTI